MDLVAVLAFLLVIRLRANPGRAADLFFALHLCFINCGISFSWLYKKSMEKEG
jgi:hypothetical protein